MKEYAVVYEKSENEWWAYVPDLPGCTSGGKTLEEAQEGIKEAIGIYLDGLVEDGHPIPEPVTVVGTAQRSA